MKISKMRGLAAGAVTALVVLGSGVSAASAAPAAWNTQVSGPTTTATPLVLKVKVSPTDTRTYSCATGDITSQGFAASNYGVQAELGFNFHGLCAGPAGPQSAYVDYYGPNAVNLRGEKNGSAYLLRGSDSAAIVINGPGGFWQSNYGRGASYTVPWTNGTNPLAPVSTAVFNNTQVGITSSGQAITLTGVVRFKTPSNGLLTLI